MDKLLYVSMSGAKQAMYGISANNSNLANVNTHGFKQDLNQFRSMPVFGEGYQSRVYAMSERPGYDFRGGVVKTTGRELDMAVKGDGWLAVQANDGREAYSRSGELHINAEGMLVNNTGQLVIGNGGPIAIPQADNVHIGVDGTISIKPVGQQGLVIVDRIKLVKPELEQLYKGNDGLFRLKNGTDAEADASVQVVSGSLETSNVNVVNAMVKMIELQRLYETQVKLMKTAEELDEGNNKLLQMS